MVTLTRFSAFTIENPMVLVHQGTHMPVREDGYVLITRGSRYQNGWTKGSLHDNGYLSVCVHRKTYLVHRLIAETFIENPNSKPTVDHINRERDDNRVENLRWATLAEQQANSSRSINACKDRRAYHRLYMRRLRARKKGRPLRGTLLDLETVITLPRKW